MKTHPLFLATFLALLTTGFADVRGLRIKERVDPVFPAEVTLEGLTRGTVHCIIDIDATGKVEDVLITAFTHRSFGRVVREAVRQWRFEPALLDGKPVAAQTALEFTIEGVGCVVTLDNNTYLNQRFEQLLGPTYAFHPFTLRDLDAIPVPQKTVMPFYPTEVAARLRGQVRVDFFIDETGRVRVPLAQPDAPAELAAAAMNAVRQWQFAPPLRRGDPVLVRASQEFHFSP